MLILNLNAARFPLGQTVATQGVLASVSEAEIAGFLRRHVGGDWGNVCADDALLNDNALKVCERVLSAYTTDSGINVWVITEWDRSVTTVLLPEEY